MDFQFEDTGFREFVKTLMARKILVSVKKAETEFEETDDEEIFRALNDNDLINDLSEFCFCFVGIAIYKKRIIYAYPKYIGVDDTLSKVEPQKELSQIIKVIDKYSRERVKQDIHDIDLFLDMDDKGENNILPIIFFILEDYAAYGLYTKFESILENNGEGAIYWQKTIDETYPIIENNAPFYIDFYTHKNVNDELDYIRRLHAYIVKKCAEEVQNTKLGDFFSLPNVDLIEFDGDDFSDKEYVLRRLEQELNSVFEDRKVRLLKALYAYLNGNRVLTGENEIQLIGTNSFNLVWEWVCAEVFKSQKDEYINNIDILQSVDYTELPQKFCKPPTLVELIEKPLWEIDTDETHLIRASKTFIPDYLRFESVKLNGKKEYNFYILDAKYYCMQWTDKKIFKQPGAEDIVKQYMYFFYYKVFFEQNKISCKMKNYFLMPKPTHTDFRKGNASFDFLRNLDWGVIEVRLLDPVKMYGLCLEGKHLDLSELDNIESKVVVMKDDDGILTAADKGKPYNI